MCKREEKTAVQVCKMCKREEKKQQCSVQKQAITEWILFHSSFKNSPFFGASYNCKYKVWIQRVSFYKEDNKVCQKEELHMINECSVCVLCQFLQGRE